MITQDVVAGQILAYLNGRIALDALVTWAEDAIVIYTEAVDRPPHGDHIWQPLLYLGAADTEGFPLTWETVRNMLAALGRPIQQVTA